MLPAAPRSTPHCCSPASPSLTAITGIGTAWLVTAYHFPGRNALCWLLPLPLAIPTYIVAYVYVDIFDALGPVQSALRALFGCAPRPITGFRDVRSLPGAIFVISFVLYPYVYLAARAMFQTQSASLIEVARTLGATRLHAGAPCRVAAGAAGARGRAVARACSRRSTISAPANISACTR